MRDLSIVMKLYHETLEMQKKSKKGVFRSMTDKPICDAPRNLIDYMSNALDHLC